MNNLLSLIEGVKSGEGVISNICVSQNTLNEIEERQGITVLNNKRFVLMGYSTFLGTHDAVIWKHERKN